MNRHATRSSSFRLAFAFASLVGVAAAACSSEAPAAPSVPPPGTTPVTPGADGGPGGGDGAPGTPGGECFDPSKQKPTEAQHFLNQCNDAGCFPFDNAARIQGFVPGAQLPPLN